MPDYCVIAPRWRGFAIRAFTEMFSTLIMKLVLGHTAKKMNSSNPALYKIIAMHAVGTDCMLIGRDTPMGANYIHVFDQ